MKKSGLIICILVALAALTSSLSGCTSSQPIEKAVVCSEVTSTGEPKTISDTFKPDVKTIYCSIKLASIAVQSNVKAEWYVVKSEEAGLTNSLIGVGNAVAGSTYVVISFARSDKLLPKGDYEVKLYFNNNYVQSVPFKVQGEAAASTATLSDITLGSAIDVSSEKPIDKKDLFPNDTENIYCSFKLNNAGFDTNVTARWTYLTGELANVQNKVIREVNTKSEGREYISFSIGVPNGKKFPIGDYSITLSLEGKEQTSVPFKVTDAASVKWPYLGGMTIFAENVSDNKTTLLTTPFSTDVKEIIIVANAYNAPPGTELSVQWLLKSSADKVFFDKLISESKLSLDGTQLIQTSLKTKTDPFVKGDYEVKLLINGVENVVVPFTVR